MLISKSSLLNVPIMSLQTGTEVAQTETLIIDPRQLKVIAFYCKGSRLDISPAVLLVNDIREISKVGLIVDSADTLVGPEDLVRLKDVLSFKFALEDKLVVDDNGKKVGNVINFALDNSSFFIIKIHVRPGLLKSWKTAEIIIDRSQIIEVTDSKIVVKAPTIKATASQIATPIVDNPFRHSQAESSTTKERV